MPTYVQNVNLFPSRLIVGDAIEMSITLSDYPATTHTLSYALVKDASTSIAWTASADGDDHSLSVDSATTAAYTAGTYAVQVYVTDAGGDRITIGEGKVEVVANFVAGGIDPRSHNRIVLEAIRAVIQQRATVDQESYSIEGRSLSRTSIPDLMKLEKEYARRVADEDRAAAIRAGKTRGNQIKTHFVES